MSKLFYRAAFLLLAAGLWAAGPGLAATDPVPESASSSDAKISDPESGSVSGDAYRNGYFDLAFKVPSGWAEGLQGPPPSLVGYYVLGTLEEAQPGKSSMLVAAQDLFFGVKPFAGAADMAKDFESGLRTTPLTTIVHGPTMVKIAGHDFQRIDYDSGGLARSWLATDLRCHVLIFSYTGADRAPVEKAIQALDSLSIGAKPEPICVKGYVTRDTIVHIEDPPPIHPKGLKIPVRLIIGKDGHVRHVHVISAEPRQRRFIAEAMMEWELKPYLVNGEPVEFETGVIAGEVYRGATIPQ